MVFIERKHDSEKERIKCIWNLQNDLGIATKREYALPSWAAITISRYAIPYHFLARYALADLSPTIVLPTLFVADSID